MNSLKQKSIAGLSWSLIEHFANKGIHLAISIVLARILLPRDFGLIGMITIFIALSETFINSGFTTALLRKKHCTEAEYNTVFYSNVVISIVFYIILFLSAGLVSSFFEEPQLTKLIRVLAFVLIIKSASIVQTVDLTKKVNFKLQAVISLIAAIIAGVVGISLALTGYGVWALVFMQLTTGIITTVLLWTMNGWRPKFLYSWSAFQDLFAFGSKILASVLINQLFGQINKVIIGKYYSASALGYYQMADNLKTLPSTGLTRIIQRVTLPVLVNLEGDIERIKTVYRKFFKSTFYVTSVAMLVLAAVSEPLVITLVGEKWLPAVAFLQLLCFVGLVQPLQSLNISLITMQGRSDVLLKIIVLRQILGIPIIFLGVFVSIKAMVIGLIVSNFGAYLLYGYYGGKFIDYGLDKQFKDIFPIIVLSFAVGSTTFFIGWALQQFSPLLALTSQILWSLLLTVVLSLIFNFYAFTELQKALRRYKI